MSVRYIFLLIIKRLLTEFSLDSSARSLSHLWSDVNRLCSGRQNKWDWATPRPTVKGSIPMKNSPHLR